jgi:glycerophosphoryl diester phosphodiesterase
MTVQLIHLAGIYSTISFPLQIVEQLNQYPLLKLAIFTIIGFLVILFFETSFSLNLYTIDQLSFKQAYKQSRQMINSHRLKMFGEFISLNIFLNIIFYGVYMLVILLISLFVMITRDQSYILSVLLTFMYSIYAIFGLIATTFLIPINYALLSTWYYQRKESLGLTIRTIKLTDKQRKSFDMKILRRVSALVLVILFAINISSVIDATRNNRVPIEFFNYSEIIAHRGASNDAPENTLAAIELALLQGSDGVEIDVRLSADRYPVLIHDATTGRTTDDILDRRVNALTLEQLKSLDAGSWFSTAYQGEKIPSLDEALDLIAGRANVFVELKSTNQILEIETIRIIEKYEMENSTIILSFDKEQLKRIKSLNSDIKTMLLVPVFYGNIDTFLSNKDIDAYGFSRDIITENTDYIDIAHQLNKKVYAWTVNEKADLQDVVSIDVDGIITDRPITAREVAYSKNTSTLLQDFLREFLDRE